LENCKSTEEYVNKIFETAQKLDRIGFNDEWIDALLLADLSDEYKPMIMGIESSGTAITGEFIKTSNCKIHVEQSSGNQQKAFIDRKKSFKPGNQNTGAKKDGPRCYSCNKYGHISRNCKNKSNKSSDKSSEGSDKVFMAPIVYNVNNVHKIAKSTWCLDSGASSHVSPNKNQFFNLKKMPATLITMADNSNVKSHGIGKLIYL